MGPGPNSNMQMKAMVTQSMYPLSSWAVKYHMPTREPIMNTCVPIIKVLRPKKRKRTMPTAVARKFAALIMAEPSLAVTLLDVLKMFAE